MVDWEFRRTASISQLMNQKKLCPRIISIIPKRRGRKDRLICSRLEPLILGSGLEDLEMALAFKCGLMEQGMRDSGRIIELMVMEGLCISMEMFTKEIGSMIKQMALVSMYM